MPAKAGIHPFRGDAYCPEMDSGVRRNDTVILA
jgi:hypothetical protein